MSSAAAWFQRGLARHQAGELIEAIDCYGRALALGGRSYEVYYSLALALQTRGKEDEALANYAEAVRLHPQLGEAHNNAGNIFFKRGQWENAQHSYERALAINGGLVQAHFNLGLVLKQRGAPSKALDHFRTACRLAPAYTDAWTQLCDLLSALKRQEEWLAALLAFEKIAPPSAYLVVAGLASCRYLGDFQREQRCLAQALAWQFGADDMAMLSGLLGVIQYFDVTQAQLLALYRRYNQLAHRNCASEAPLLAPARKVGDRLRVGYLSPDFRSHVMGHLMLEVFQRHDRSRFEIHAYSLAETGFDDAVTARFKGLSDSFVAVAGLSDAQAARRIAEDDLDLLVDLGGHAAYARPAIMAYRPARKQITHLGYHGALGLDTVDYKLTDAYADLPQNADFLIEDLLVMEGCLFPFRHVAPAPEHGYSRSALGLAGKVVFGVFVNILKLSPRCLALWRQILDAVEQGVLAFSPLDASEYPGFLRQAKAAGIAEDRVVFIPYAKDERVARARYQMVDIVLDTFPYGGGDTTLAALDMGVPVVTLRGTRHSERISYSLLKNLGVTSTVAGSEQEFVAIAEKLAGSGELRQQLREEIQAGLRQSPLVDMDAYVRHLEAAYGRAANEGGASGEVKPR